MSKSFFARRTVAATLSTMVLVTAANAQSSAQALKYPETRKSDHTDTYHGTVVTDPYRWLEDDNSAETKAWVKAQNAVTDKFLEAMPQRMPVRKIYTELYNFERYGLPSKEGGRYFWSRNDGLQQQSVIYMAKSLADKPVVAIDPNQFAKDGTVALTGMKVSRNGRYAAYGKAVAGSDWQVWQVRDLDTGKDLADKTEWVKFSSAEWTPDGKGFFYSRYDAPKEGAALSGVNYFQKLYYHRIGTPQSADQLIYENPVEKEWGFGASVTDDGKHVIINVWKGSGRKNGLLVMPLKSGAVPAVPASVLKTITLDFDAEFTPIGANGNTLWVKTDLAAPRGRVVAIDLTKRERANWKTVVVETKDTLTSADVVGGKILAQYLQDAATAVIVHGLDGKKLSSVSLPGVGSASGFLLKLNDIESFFSYTCLLYKSDIYRYVL
ncbi:MAG: hypothetical protein ACK511_11210 [Burkholderiales bacterium]